MRLSSPWQGEAGGSSADPASAFAKKFGQKSKSKLDDLQKEKRSSQYFGGKNEEVLELSQIQNGFAKTFEWHRNSLGN